MNGASTRPHVDAPVDRWRLRSGRRTALAARRFAAAGGGFPPLSIPPPGLAGWVHGEGLRARHQPPQLDAPMVLERRPLLAPGGPPLAGGGLAPRGPPRRGGVGGCATHAGLAFEGARRHPQRAAPPPRRPLFPSFRPSKRASSLAPTDTASAPTPPAWRLHPWPACPAA